MGICDSSKDKKIDLDYIEEKGINEKHNHMLTFCKPFMRKDSDSFICLCCNKEFENTGSYHCINCNFNICKECFNYSGGILFDKIQDGKKGIIYSHSNHQLIYGKSNSKGKKNSKLNDNLLYMCNKCNCYFLIDYIKCWSCPQCDYNICDKCFRNTGGKEIQDN